MKMEITGVKTWHGSSAYFENFSYAHMGNNANSEGYGFYTTDKKRVAMQYATRYLYTFDFCGKKSLSSKKITFSRIEMQKFLRVLEQRYHVVSDVYDTAFYGLDKSITMLMSNIREGCRNDVDVIADICNMSGEKENILRTAYELFGYDHIKTVAEWGNQTLYIATVPNALQLKQIYDVQQKKVLFEAKR